MQEGSNWEAAMLASAKGLDGLCVVVDRNGLQQGRRTESVSALEPLRSKWEAFGWAVEEVDGHDMSELASVLQKLPLASGRPSCVLANTTKGKGVSFMENDAAWHHRLPTGEEAARASAELRGWAPR